MQQFAVLKIVPCVAAWGSRKREACNAMRCRKVQLENRVDQTGEGSFLSDTGSEDRCAAKATRGSKNRLWHSYVISLDRQHL